jgi:hypothetical protein
MHTEAYQFSVPAPLNPAQRLFRSLDGNADGQITSYEIKTSGVLLPKAPAEASAKPATDGKASKDDDAQRNAFSSLASRFQYFLAMMTQAAPVATADTKASPRPALKPAEANPYLKTGNQTAPHADTLV